MGLRDHFDRTMSSLHDAMLDDTHWPTASRLIDEACEIRGNALVVGKGRSQADGEIFLSRFCYHGERQQDREQWYFNSYYALDERVPRVARLPDSRLVPITELYTDHELKTSLAYNEALPRGGYQHGLNVRLDVSDGCSIVWTLADCTERGVWSSAQTEMIERLLPHIRQYVQVRSVIAGAQALGASLRGLLGNTRVGVIYLDRSGRIVETNDRARQVLRRGDGLFDQGGFLCAQLPKDNVRFERLLREALPRYGTTPTSGSLMVRRPSNKPRLAVYINPVSVPQPDFVLESVAALVLVVDPASRSTIDTGLVAAALDLTPSQSQVAVMLAEGRSVLDIATATGRQPSTVRQLLKQVHRRRGVTSRTELVRLVLSLSDLPNPGY